MSLALRCGNRGLPPPAGTLSDLLCPGHRVARGAGRTLRYENIPTQLHQLARLSDVDALLSGS